MELARLVENIFILGWSKYGGWFIVVFISESACAVYVLLHCGVVLYVCVVSA